MARASMREGGRRRAWLSDRAKSPMRQLGCDQERPTAVHNPTDINFASIVRMDRAGGWHILRLSLNGSIIQADAAALKVLQQFFGEPANWSSGLPTEMVEKFFESREWGIGRLLSRSWRSFVVVRFVVKLTAQLIPDADGGYLVLKIVQADTPTLPLTEREHEVVTLVAMGKTNVEIGFLLHISARTVQKHLENIFRKLGVETRTALASRAMVSGSD